jgi:hypothetical protein
VDFRKIDKRNHLYRVKLIELRDLLAKKQDRSPEDQENDL